jgi:predicted Zn-dependent protease
MNPEDEIPREPAPGGRSLLAAAALVGVIILFILFLGQRSSIRELRAMVLNERANSALAAGDGVEAGRLLDEVAALDSDTAGLWRRRAVAHMMAGQPFEAATAAREHLKINPGDAATSALLSAAQITARDYDGAEETLVAALEIAPNQRDLVQNFSELRRLQRKPGEAAAIIDRYLAQNPGDGFFLFKRVMAEVAGELTAERRKAIADSIAAGQATAAIYVVGAAIDFRDGNPDAAREKLGQAGQRTSPQELRTMLEDEFFRDFLTSAQAAPTPAPEAR